MTEVHPTHRSAATISPERAHYPFEAQAARAPDTCAVVMVGGGIISYGDLNRRADVLAGRLRGLGVGQESIVGICLERSIDAVAAILAVLKAGGAYLPLDPAYPIERTTFMLENSRARVLITNTEINRDWPAGLTIVHPESDFQPGTSDDQRAAVCNEESGVDPLAYVIYTSGSTGKPKGVAMPHAPLCNLLRWHINKCPLAPGSRVLQFAPSSFDVGFQEIFSTLGEGGTLVVIQEALRRDSRALLRLLDEQNITRVFLPPVMLSQLAEQHASGGLLPRGLREIITAGEALKITPTVKAFCSALRNQKGNCTLHNHYGPTETHVVTAYTLEGEVESWPALPCIGKPIDGVQIKLLNDNGEPVEPGQPGALYLGGSCLARGYLHDPELTGAKFISTEGARWYRSGDLAQVLPDGNLQFLGRADDQVKIRGFRIELGEIETVLARHPAIKETAVGVTPNANGGSQELFACFVPRDPGSAPSPADLRLWLRGQIPEYMIPTRFAVIERLPLTPSGKVDRRALPPGDVVQTAAATSAPPRTPMERLIARVWHETLGLESPGVQDNFFEVGGNSLHAMQVHTKLCQELGREFPITALFQHPTITALALHLSADDRAATGSSIQDRARRQQQQQAAARVRFAGRTS